jgi:polyhydroxyalkanoate synthesis repressor PhaR
MIEKPQEPQIIDIRRYPNRRYYDTSRSRHLTLEEIHTLIREGHEVRVTDSKTGEDITAKVLAQIILELDPPKLAVFPPELLHRLIRANQQIVTDFTDKYFTKAFMSFMESQRQFENYLREAMGLGTSSPFVPDLTRMMMNPFAAGGFWGSKTQPPPAPAPPAAQPGPAEQADLRSALEALQAQVSRLQEQLDRTADPPSGPT